jgi:DNA-binding CsgD family transcriptional regulator
MEAIRRSIARLSSHEIAMLSRIADGKTNAQLGVELHRSEKTIRNQLTSLYAKLGANNRAAAVAIYLRLEKFDQV